MQKYHAIWELDGNRVLVLPRTKKRMTFDSIAEATLALERRAKTVRRNSRGFVKCADETVLTIAL